MPKLTLGVSLLKFVFLPLLLFQNVTPASQSACVINKLSGSDALNHFKSQCVF